MSIEILKKPFDLETHKKTFINYLEVIILEDGTIEYAIPSHQEKLISIASQKLNMTRGQLIDSCPDEFYFDFTNWLCIMTSCIAVWNSYILGKPNESQEIVIKKLIEEKMIDNIYVKG